MEIAHEDLAANVVPNGSWNFNTSTTDPTNTAATTGDHGTSVSGLIAMARNTVGGIGVAPSARLKGFNFLSSMQTLANFIASLGGSSTNPNSSDVFVFNQSFGISPSNNVPIDPTEEAQYLSGVTSLRGGKGALYVKAAGNGFNDATRCASTGLSCEMRISIHQHASLSGRGRRGECRRNQGELLHRGLGDLGERAGW